MNTTVLYSKWLPLASLFALGALLFAGLGCGRGEDPGAITTLRIALEPDRDPEAILEDSAAFKKFIEERTGMPVEVVVPLSGSVTREGFRNGTLDVGYLNSTATVRLGDVVEVALVTLIDGRSTYESYWLTLAGQPFESIADLRGKPVAFSSRSSTSGFIVPVVDLLDQGLISAKEGPEGFFGQGNVFYGTGYVSAVERVLDGSAMAAAVSYYVYEKDRHLSEEQRARLRVLDRQGPVPTHLIAVRSNLPAETKAKIRDAFAAFGESRPDARDRLFGAPLAVVDGAEHLAPAVRALQLVEDVRF